MLNTLNVIEAQQQVYSDWLRTRKWDYWVTANFHMALSESTAMRHVREWLDALQRARDCVYRTTEGQRVYAAVALERGPNGNHVHVHALVGGLGGHPAIPPQLSALWRWGHVLSSRYDAEQDPRGAPKSGACAYLVKHPDSITLIGKLQKYRPRR